MNACNARVRFGSGFAACWYNFDISCMIWFYLENFKPFWKGTINMDLIQLIKPRLNSKVKCNIMCSIVLQDFNATCIDTRQTNRMTGDTYMDRKPQYSPNDNMASWFSNGLWNSTRSSAWNSNETSYEQTAFHFHFQEFLDSRNKFLHFNAIIQITLYYCCKFPCSPLLYLFYCMHTYIL